MTWIAIQDGVPYCAASLATGTVFAIKLTVAVGEGLACRVIFQRKSTAFGCSDRFPSGDNKTQDPVLIAIRKGPLSLMLRQQFRDLHGVRGGALAANCRLTHQNVRPFGCERSRRMRPTKTSSRPVQFMGIG